MELLARMNDEEWIMSLANLVYIFEQQNKLYLLRPGMNRNIIKLIDALKSFISRLEIIRKMSKIMFEKL